MKRKEKKGKEETVLSTEMNGDINSINPRFSFSFSRYSPRNRPGRFRPIFLLPTRVDEQAELKDNTVSRGWRGILFPRLGEPARGPTMGVTRSGKRASLRTDETTAQWPTIERNQREKERNNEDASHRQRDSRRNHFAAGWWRHNEREDRPTSKKNRRIREDSDASASRVRRDERILDLCL